MISRLRYTFREMWASLSRNLTLTVAAVITSTVSLFLFGGTLLIQRAFDNQLKLWTGGVEMIVYVKHGADEAQVKLVESALLSQSTVVESATYCDEACSLEVAKTLFATDPSALEQLTPQIPSFFKVKPVDQDSSEILRSLKTEFSTLPNVTDVRTPDDAVDLLGRLKSFFGVRTLVMSVVLLFASALLIWNTIRTAMFARRREIEVMKLVGATNWFIRLPFMLEGLLQGIFGATLGSIALLLANDNWTNGVKDFPVNSGLKAFVVTDGYPLWVCFWMIVLGAFVGAVGSATAASRFLDVSRPDGTIGGSNVAAMSAMDYTQILYEVSDRIATITLNRPEQLNAFTGTMMREVIDAFDQVDADDDVRVVIVTGAGRGFCAGADLSGGGDTFSRGGSDEIPADVGVPRDGGGMVALRIFECKKPVIGAINGAAVGVGVTMTLPMDIRLASEHAKFGFVFARRGIVPEACSSWFLPRLVGISQAAEWCYSGRVFPAAEALAGGLVRSVHPPTSCCRRHGRSPPRSPRTRHR